MAQDVNRLLKQGGFLVFEVGMGQAEAVMSILGENGFGAMEITKDDSG